MNCSAAMVGDTQHLPIEIPLPAKADPNGHIAWSDAKQNAFFVATLPA